MIIYEILFKLISVLILFIIGYLIAEVFLHLKLKEKIFWLYPWLGTAFVSCVGTVLYFANLPMNVGKYIIAAISLCFFFYAIFNCTIKICFSKENTILFIIVIVLMLSNPYDIQSNIYTKAEFLINNFFGVTKGAYRDFYQDTNFIGTSSVISFFSSLLQTKTYEAVRLLQPIYLAFSYPLFVILLTKINTIKNRLLINFISIVLFLCINLLFRFANFSINHILFFGMIFLFSFLAFKYLDLVSVSKINIIRPTLTEILLALIFSSLAAIYPFGMKFFMIFFVFICLLNLYQKDKWKRLMILGKILLFGLIINPIVIGISLNIK